MSSQLIFFKKSKADFADPKVSASASQGNTFAKYALNRSNLSGWATTGSVDADNTTFTVNMSDMRIVNNLIMINHNFKAYKLEYYNGITFVDFSPAINVTGVTATTSRHHFTNAVTSQIRLTVYGTQVANSDKHMAQFLPLELIGQLDGWPVLKTPELGRNRQKSKMLSGKMSVRENVGGYSVELDVANWSNDADLTIVETLYALNDGFLFWPSAGDEAQFRTTRQGYRLEDIFLMKCTNEYRPEWYKGFYQSGMKLTLMLSEVID